jgi:heat-inducible transcriptional repressor
MDKVLRERDHSILQAIISSYIETGEPVGSRFLSKKYDLRLSPATIRNIMSDLEEMGYLNQPHISAGRVPTDKAYRFYVDCLVKGPGPKEEGMSRLMGVSPSQEIQPGALMRETSRTLSKLSSYIGLVLAPPFLNTHLKHVEFIKLRENQVMVVLVSQEGLIQNKVIRTEKEHSQGELDRIGSVLNEKYSKQPLSEVREKILEEMTEEKNLYDSLLERAMKLAEEALHPERQEGDIFMDGTANVLSLPEFADVEKMKALFKAFEEKSRLIDLLDRCLDAEGVKIFIGAENPYSDMHDLSLITAPYKKDGRVFGVIGVLGPTRMTYGRVIPIVDHTARHLSRLLSDNF